MNLSIRYNRSTTHIEGIPACTPGTGEERGGVISYYAQSACAGLTRSGYKMAYGDTGFTTATEALKAARVNASASGRKLCAHCEKAAKWAASCEGPTSGPEFEAEKDRVNAELEESNRRYKEAEAARKADNAHAAAVAQMRANREAEEEERAAARRARNRTNYAPAPEAGEDNTITREPEGRTLTEVEEMEDQYQDLVHVGRGLRLLSDQFCRLLAEMKDGEGLDEDDARFQRIKRKLDRNLKLEGNNLDARTALSVKIREARKTGRCLMRGGEYGGPSLQCLQLRGHTGDCKNSRGETFTNWLDPEDLKAVHRNLKATRMDAQTPVLVMDAEMAPEVKEFHRKVKDAINLKW